MNDIIESLSDFVGVINNIANDLRHDMFRNDKLLFRGQPDTTYKLLPSIARRQTWYGQQMNWFEKEMVEEAIGKRPDIFGIEPYPIDLLTKLQHYGLPTRLLDVTYNSLVALYFACISSPDADGEVIVFKLSSDQAQYMYYYNNGLVNMIAQMYKIGELKNCTIDRFLEIIDLDKYDEIKLSKLNKGENSFPPEIINMITNPIFISPSNLSERQKRQQGAFIIFPNKIDNNHHISAQIPEMLKNFHYITKIIIIPKENKEILLRQLFHFGIHKEFLFPDSIDVLCESITENVLHRM